MSVFATSSNHRVWSRFNFQLRLAHLQHEVNTTEIYYMVEGAATLVTGGTLRPPGPAIEGTSARSPGIDGGVSRRITKGDVVIIPGHTPHWWSELETDIEYLIFRPDPDNRLTLK